MTVAEDAGDPYNLLAAFVGDGCGEGVDKSSLVDGFSDLSIAIDAGGHFADNVDSFVPAATEVAVRQQPQIKPRLQRALGRSLGHFPAWGARLMLGSLGCNGALSVVADRVGCTGGRRGSVSSSDGSVRTR